MADRGDNVIWADFTGRRGTPGRAGARPAARRRAARDAARTWAARTLVDRVLPAADRGRVDRGRDYHAEGRVVELTLAAGAISALVRGTQLDPFTVILQLPWRGEAERDRAVAAIAAAPGGVLAALNGALPAEEEHRLLLGPGEWLRCSCDCPDPAEYCKHIIAVTLAAAAALDADPALLLRLRGITDSDLRRAQRRAVPGGDGAEGPPRGPAAPSWRAVDQAIPPGGGDFWGRGLPPPEVPEVTAAPALAAADRALLEEALATVCYGRVDETRLISDLEVLYEALAPVRGRGGAGSGDDGGDHDPDGAGDAGPEEGR